MCPGPDERVSFQRTEREAAGRQANALERIADALEQLLAYMKPAEAVPQMPQAAVDMVEGAARTISAIKGDNDG